MKFLSKTLEEGQAVFTLGDGKAIKVDLNAFDAEMRDKLAMHGLFQKIGDGASGYSRTLDYKGAFAEMTAIVTALSDDLWTRKGGGTGTSDLVQALANLTGKPLADCQTVVDGFDDDKMKLIKKRADVKAEIKRLQLERADAAAKAEDIDSLDELF